MSERSTLGLPPAPEGAALDLLCAVDWQACPVGAPEDWPAALKIGLALILNSAEAMWLAWGKVDQVFFFNDAYAPLLGPRVARSMAQPFAEVWSDVWDQVSASIGAVFAGGSERFVDMRLMMARRGIPEETWWTYSLSPFRDETGEVVGLLCLTGEQTSRIHDETRRREHTAALEAQVEDGQASLSRAEDHLRQSQKIEAIGQLTGGVAHDFNNLLTVIRGSVDLLRKSDLSEERRLRYIDAIGDTAERATKLTGQLLAFARRQTLRPQAVNISDALTDLGNIVRTLTGSRITVETIVPTEELYGLADRSQFDTAIVNMAVNARDAMSGEGHLVIAAGAVSGLPAIRTHEPVAGDFIAVTVTDTGHGIAADEMAQIFEPFFTTKAVGEGTGLGLSQVIGFAKQSGGDIRVESVPGKGTTFTLYIPRTQADYDVGLSAEAPVVVSQGDGICVLVVEDNTSVGDFAVDALQTLGYDSVITRNALQALAELEKDCSRFHVVFSDVVMPGMNGLELGKEIRRLYPDVPVVLTSGYSHVLTQNGRHGFELLHKPYSIEQLTRVLAKAIAWQASQRTH